MSQPGPSPLEDVYANPVLDPLPTDTKRTPRNIVVLLDGTANQFSAKNSNVIKLMSVIQVDEKQLTYYSSGIGTILPQGAGTWSRFKREVAKAQDMGFATNFAMFVCDAYKFLMDHYQSGDKVYLFGFSRGAYSARTLAGMIQKVGLLPRGNHNQVELAWGVYNDPAQMGKIGGLDTNANISMLYRRIFGISRQVSIHFVGVWDTVASLGGLRAKQMEFAAGIGSVTFFRHALALNERRSAFVQENRVPNEDEKPVNPGEVLAAKHECNAIVAHPQHRELHYENGTRVQPPRRPRAVTEVEVTRGIQSAFPPLVALRDPDDCYAGVERANVECWFMGCHSDVGGGNTLNDQDSLSNIPFRWMLREAEACGLRLGPVGIALQTALNRSEAVVKDGLIPLELIELLNKDLYGTKRTAEQKARDTLEVERLIRQHLQPHQIRAIVTTAAKADSAGWDAKDEQGGPMTNDLLQPMYESLTGAWNLLELLSFERTRADPKDKSSQNGTKWTINWWGGRQIALGQAIHYSVLKRLRHDGELGKRNPSKYGIPPAKLPNEWGVGWQELIRGEGPDIWEA